MITSRRPQPKLIIPRLASDGIFKNLKVQKFKFLKTNAIEYPLKTDLQRISGLHKIQGKAQVYIKEQSKRLVTTAH